MMLMENPARLLREMLFNDAPVPHCEPAQQAAGTPSLIVDELEARKLLGGLCAKTMYNLRKQGLPFVRIGTRVMYDPRELSRWVGQQRVTEN